MLVGCSDDDNLSPVDVTITMSGVTQSNDNFYAIAGDEVSCSNILAKAVDGKNTTVANMTFYLNGMPIPYTPYDPFFTLSTEGMEPGTYTISFAGNLLQEDTSIKVFSGAYTLTLVENAENLPEGAPEIGDYSISFRISN